MKKRLITAVCLGMMFSSMLQAEKWIPEVPDCSLSYRLLGCSYDQAELRMLQNVAESNSDWNVTVTQKNVDGGTRYTFTFTAKKNMAESGVAVAFDHYGWSSDNYVMIPASVYNGNRQRIVNRQYGTGLDQSDYFRKDLAMTSNPIPQLSPEFGAESLLEVLVNNAATPAITYLDRRNNIGTILLTDQGITCNGSVLDHALIVEESSDRKVASFVISAPGVRAKKPEFVGFSKSPDRGISVKKGDNVTLSVTRLDFYCEGVTGLLAQFMKYRKSHTQTAPPRNLMPMSEVLKRMAKNIDERYIKGKVAEFYCPENANWMSFGWIGGLMNTYPMLALGDAEHLRRVTSTFDFALPRGKGKSGYYYDTLNEDGKVLNRTGIGYLDEIGLTRKNADVLYWMIKQFNLLKSQGKAQAVRPEWETEVRKLADAFVRTWEQCGTWGNYIQVETGEVAAYNTSGGVMAIAGLTLAAEYFGESCYLELAKEAADYYYRQFALVGFTAGACSDILQNADSETSVAFATALITLYEATGEAKYLEQAKDLAHLCATWTVSFDYRLPGNTDLAKLNANLTGAVWASTQNKHGAPGFCTQSGDVLFKLYRTTGDELYAELLRDVIHAHAEGIQPNGKITERLTYCDADSRGSRLDGGKTGWNETNGALMALEIPGIYVRKDLRQLYVFDHVEARLLQKGSETVLEITNPTAYDAEVTVLAEDMNQAQQPLKDNAFLTWKQKVKVKSGKTVKYILQ